MATLVENVSKYFTARFKALNITNPQSKPSDCSCTYIHIKEANLLVP